MYAGFMSKAKKVSSSSSSSAKKPAADWYAKQFEVYYDEAENQISPAGVEKLCEALKLDPSDVHVLVLAWLLDASQMGYFSRDEWMAGVPELGHTTSSESLVEQLATNGFMSM